jgi:hypothetical protein
VSPAASCLAVVVAFGTLCVVCCLGIATFAVRSGVDRAARVTEERVNELRGERRLVEDAEALLDEIALRLEAVRAVERAYPRALPEAPPPDPWGNAVEYEPVGPDRAWLRSAGPDGTFRTSDDVVRDLAGR